MKPKERILPELVFGMAIVRGIAANRFCEAPRSPEGGAGTTTVEGAPGLNYLCAGWYNFFTHIDHPVKIIASLLRAGRPAADVMSILKREEADMAVAIARAGRNGLCPCGSGLKTKQCHGRRRARAAPQPVRLPVYQAQPRASVVAVSE